MRQSKYYIILIMCVTMLFICFKALEVNFDSLKEEVSTATKSGQTLVLVSIPPDVTDEPIGTSSDSEQDPQETTLLPAKTKTVFTTILPIPTKTKSPVKKTDSPSKTAEVLKTPSVKATKKPQTEVITTKSPTKTKAPSLSIPAIYSPSTPGDSLYYSEDKNVIMDASNRSKGYVAIKYKGTNQKVKVQVIKESTTYNYDLPSNGNYVIYPLQFKSGTYTIQVLENISSNRYMPVFFKSINVNIKNANSVFLYPNQYVWFKQDSAVVTKAAKLCQGKSKDIDKISAIFKYVTANISYDYNKADTVKPGYLPNVDKILASKKGICFDYAALFAAMCRAQHIPTKLVTGYVSPNGVYHAWNEVYTKEKGWITVNFYLKKVGFNLVDPTFYSNMDDSKEAASYIGNGSNYQVYHFY